VFVTDEVVGWQPKRRARPKLKPWEEDSEGDEGGAHQQQLNTRDHHFHRHGNRPGEPGEWGPFAAEGASKAADRIYRSKAPDSVGSRSLIPEVLPSYEEEVLGLRRTGGGAALGKRTGGSHFTEQQEEGQYRQEVKDAARKEGLDVYEVSLLHTRTKGGGHWERSGNAIKRELIGSSEADTLSLFTDPELHHFEDFDAEAEFFLKEPHYAAGLAFRCDDDDARGGSEHLLFVVNVEGELPGAKKKAKLLQYPSLLGVNEYSELLCCDIDHDDVPIQHWFQIRVRAVKNAIALFLEHRQIGQCRVGDGMRMSGCLGVWCKASSTVHVQHVVAIDLSKYSKDLTKLSVVDQELEIVQRGERDRLADLFLATRSCRVIQQITRLKLGLVDQRKRFLNDLERLNRQAKFRDKSMRTWVTLLVVFSQLDKTLRESDDLWAKKYEKHCDLLDVQDPPPLPPPVEQPPRSMMGTSSVSTMGS
jgi:hypothetical protein